MQTSWSLMFATILWYLWKWRCASIFQPDFCRPDRPVEVISNYVWDWLKANEEFCIRRILTILRISWLPPIARSVKLNTDSSCTLHGTIAAGGLIRDDQGNWLLGYTMSIGRGTIQRAELRGVLEGLQLAWRYGYNSLIVECDSYNCAITTKSLS